MCGRLFHRTHFVEINLRAEFCGLPRRLDSRQPTANNIYVIRVHLFFTASSALRLRGRVDFVILYITREMFVIAPFDRLVVIAEAKHPDPFASAPLQAPLPA